MDTINRLPTIIRWILILPTSILAYMAVYFVGHVTMYIAVGYLSPDSLFSAVYDLVFNHVVAVMASIFSSAYVAPSKNRAVAIFISFAWTILAVFGVFSSLNLGESGSASVWQVVTQAAATIAICIYVCIKVKDSDFGENLQANEKGEKQ